MLCIWASSIAQLRKNPPARQETLVKKIPWRWDRLPTPVFLGFPGGSDSKESACNAGDLGLIPGLERSPGEGHGNPIQYFGLENPHEQRSLVGYSPRGRKESDMTERLSLSFTCITEHSHVGMITPILTSQMRKLKLREVWWLTQDHTSNEWWIWDLCAVIWLQNLGTCLSWYLSSKVLSVC